MTTPTTALQTLINTARVVLNSVEQGKCPGLNNIEMLRLALELAEQQLACRIGPHMLKRRVQNHAASINNVIFGTVIGVLPGSGFAVAWDDGIGGGPDEWYTQDCLDEGLIIFV